MPRKKSIERGELSPANEKYCQARANGLSQRQAYTASRPGSSATGKSKDEISSHLESDIKIQSRIEELKRRAAAGLILDRDSLAAMLADMAADTSRSDGIRLKAADQLSRIIGAYEDRQTVDVRAAVLTASDKADALRGFLSGMINDKG